MKNVLKYPQIVTMWSAWFAELSAKYFTPLRFDTNLFVSRAEWGPKSGNPHFHQVTYSENLSKYIFDKTQQLHKLLERLSRESLSQGHALTDAEVQTSLTTQLTNAWEDFRVD